MGKKKEVNRLFKIINIIIIYIVTYDVNNDFIYSHHLI